jgi:hypothetical protein
VFEELVETNVCRAVPKEKLPKRGKPRRNAPVLPSLRVWSKYQDLPLKTSKGDDTKERTVPVHPDLGRELRRWKLHGFA